MTYEPVHLLRNWHQRQELSSASCRPFSVAICEKPHDILFECIEITKDPPHVGYTSRANNRRFGRERFTKGSNSDCSPSRRRNRCNLEEISDFMLTKRQCQSSIEGSASKSLSSIKHQQKYARDLHSIHNLGH